MQLIDTKRSNNVGIALARLRMDDEAIKACVLDPVAHPLTPDNVSALIAVLPTAEELETIKEFTGERETLGRVEQGRGPATRGLRVPEGTTSPVGDVVLFRSELERSGASYTPLERMELGGSVHP